MVTPDEAEAAKKVERIENPLEECKRRWPDYRTEDRLIREMDDKDYREVRSLWTVDTISGGPREYGLRVLLSPEADQADIANGRRVIAIEALFNDELRKANA